jgi:hypothetical protein
MARIESPSAPTYRGRPHSLELPAFILTALQLVVIAVLSPEHRIYLLPVLMLTSAVAFAANPVRFLAMVIVLLGFPVYVQVSGRDAGTVSTFIILSAYTSALIGKRLRPEVPILLPSVLLLGIYAIGSMSLADDMLAKSLRQLLGLATAMMLMHLTLVQVKTEPHLSALITSLLAMLALQVGVSLLQLYFPDAAYTVLTIFATREGPAGATIQGWIFRATGAMGDYELLAEWLAVGIILAVGLLYSPGRFSRVLVLFLLIVFAAGILSTGTRGGAVAAATGLVCMFVILGRRSPKSVVRLALTMPLLVAFVSALSMLLLPGLVSQLADRFASSSLDSGLFETALDGGLDLNTVASILNRGFWVNLPSFVTDPHLMPYGFYSLEYSEYYQMIGATSLHSLWLTIWFQGGIVGIVVWIWMGLAVLRSHQGFGAGPVVQHCQVMAVALAAGIVAELVSEFKIEFLRGPSTMGFFFLVLGLSVAASRLAAVDRATLPRSFGPHHPIPSRPVRRSTSTSPEPFRGGVTVMLDMEGV